jgi:cell division transport system permease protein
MRFIIDFKREMREALIAFRRNGVNTLGSIIISAVALLSLSIILMMSVYIQYGTKSIGERLNLTAFFETTATNEQINDVVLQIKDLGTVSKIVYISPEQALEELKSKIPEMNDLGITDSPIPASIRITPLETNQIPSIMTELQAKKGIISSVTDVSDAANSYFGIIKIGTILGLALILIFFTGLIFAVSASTSISIFSFRREIEIMQLVGASHSFVRNPFLILGGLYGLIGGIISMGLLFPAYRQIDTFYQSLITFDPIPINSMMLMLIISVSMILFGVLAGVLSAAFSVRKYLK